MKKQMKTPLDAVKNFYLANELLSEIFDKEHKTSKINTNSPKDAVKKIKNIVKKVNKLSTEELLKYNLNNNHQRYDNYYNSTWELKEINLRDCGLWPLVGGLPHNISKGSVIDAIELIKPLLENKDKLSISTGRLLYIEELMKYVKDIVKYIPIIVMEDHVIRHNKLRPISQRKKYIKTKYDIDDGNHRALSFALLGNKKITALVGKRIYKNKILY
jgi:hypothetical protein